MILTTSRNASSELRKTAIQLGAGKKFIYFARQKKPLGQIISFARFEGVKKTIILGCREKKFILEEILVKEKSWERADKKEFNSLKELVSELSKLK